MLDNVGLIHMNGRVYDPGLGRFLSVDPVFQFPENTQSLNPYTYVLNSPLTMTDPTGLMGTCTGEDSDMPCGGFGMNGGLMNSVQNPGSSFVADGARRSAPSNRASGAMGVAGGQSVTPSNGRSVSINGNTLVDFTSADPSDLASQTAGEYESHDPTSQSSGERGLGTIFFGGAGMDGDYIADMVKALKEAGISNVTSADPNVWSKNILEDATMTLSYNDNRKIDIGEPDPGVPGAQTNVIGYSYGAQMGAQYADELTKKGRTVDNLVLIGAPISKEFLTQLRSNASIKKVIVVDLGEHGDPIRAGMSDSQIARSVFKLALQMSRDEGHFYYAGMDGAGRIRREQLAKQLYKRGLR